MENASKALLMAGGVLIGVLLLGGLLILWANISKTQAVDTGEKDSQLASFNMEFETYNKNDLYGSEILTLLNKINTYNENHEEYYRFKNQYTKIELYIDFGTKDPLGIKSKTGSGSKSDTSGYINFTNFKGTGKDTTQFLSNYINLEEKYRKKFYE